MIVKHIDLEAVLHIIMTIIINLVGLGICHMKCAKKINPCIMPRAIRYMGIECFVCFLTLFVLIAVQ